MTCEFEKLDDAYGYLIAAARAYRDAHVAVDNASVPTFESFVDWIALVVDLSREEISAVLSAIKTRQPA